MHSPAPLSYHPEMPDEIPRRRHVLADALVGALPPVAFLALVVLTLGCTAARSIEVPVSPRAGGPSVTLTGSLTMPPGRGPFPAVLLHGCDGWNERGSIRMDDAAATGDASRRVEAFLREIVGQGAGQ